MKKKKSKNFDGFQQFPVLLLKIFLFLGQCVRLQLLSCSLMKVKCSETSIPYQLQVGKSVPPSILGILIF